ncbi:MAG: alanine racemase [Acetobacteraceae bacterium]|nr:alanine racemase [Acetobacteraceae bacterium]
MLTEDQRWSQERSGAVLTIDLAAVQANYRLLAGRVGASACGAVLKAHGYGLGATYLAPAIFAAGCRHFFVAHLDEGLELRPHLDASATIYVLHGPFPGTEEVFAEHGLIPVLNSIEQINGWAGLAERRGARLPAILQVDTGMSRFGLSLDDLERLVTTGSRLERIALRYLMSHLACADEPAHPANAEQLAQFGAARRLLPGIPASLAASSGIFLGPRFHFDLVRPGAALYGVAPVTGAANPMRQVVRLQGKILQIRWIPEGAPVGYGGTYRAPACRRIATVPVGYADGFLRSAGDRGSAFLDEIELPIVGRISMDSITLDATDAPEERLCPGATVDLIGPRNPIDAVARAAGTIGYEILTSLGRRYHRRYLGGEPDNGAPWR